MNHSTPPPVTTPGVDELARRLTDLPPEVQCAIARHVLNGPPPKGTASFGDCLDAAIYELAKRQGVI